MSRIRNACCAIALGIVTSNAHAAAWGTHTVTITSYQTDTNGYVYLNTSANENPDGCANTSSLIISDTTYKFVVVTVISAYTTGETVQLYYNGCTSGYPTITAIQVPHL